MKHKTHILVVEDDPFMARLYQRILVLDGYEATMALNGQHGLQEARRIKPALVLLDIMMPKLDGFHTLDQLKADPDTAAIPVVMLTNLAGQQDIDKAFAKGAIKYIIKSEHDPKEVSSIVKEILAKYS